MKLDSFVKSLPTQGGEAWGYSCDDLRDKEQVDAIVRKITEERPPVDNLINIVSYKRIYHPVVLH